MDEELKATDIYERLEMGGSVWGDIAEAIAEGDFDAFEDYFGDLDPFEFL